MQFKIFSIVTLFILYTPSALALPGSADTASTNLNAHQPELDASHFDNSDVELAERVVPVLADRATVHCANQGQIKRVKPLYHGKCMPSQSKGWKSAHNCPGKSYLCVQSDEATCYTIAQARKSNFEGGECFL